MKYLSLCSGIEAASVAWHHMGWQPTAFSEIEPFPSAVLAHHYPHTPNWGDMTRFKEWPDANINVLVGGTPCQSFSVAGLRKGLDDPRGNLMLTYLAIADRYRPKWVVWENVPGVLSSNSGRDFGAFLGGLGQLGYGFAYRVLDAQYFGLAQRRRRVFVVGCLGGWQRAAAVLFEQHSLSGNLAPSREKGKTIARNAAAGADSSQWPKSVAPTLTADYADKMGINNQHIDSQGGGLFVAHNCKMLNHENPNGQRDGDADSYYRGRLQRCSYCISGQPIRYATRQRRKHFASLGCRKSHGYCI
jgi:DNA (cytosine-5)-methyltransferase 1